MERKVTWETYDAAQLEKLESLNRELMGIQVREAALLIQGVLLHIDPGAVDMGAQDVRRAIRSWRA